MRNRHGNRVAAYTNTMELSDGRTLKIQYITEHIPANWHHADESESSETEYFIDGVSCGWEDLPPEVTVAILEELELNADEDRSYDFGGPEPDDYADGDC